jgi:phospholipid/cholesterol/gamma-HCH transport system substrate-binding protein
MVIEPRDKKNIVLSGIFVTTLLLVGMVFIFLLGGDSSLFQNKLTLKTKVKNVQNLKLGAVVQLKGIKVGTVKSISFASMEAIIITFDINSEYQPWIKQNSYLSIKTQGVLGDKFMEILGGTDEAKAIKANEFLEIEETSSVDKMLGKGEDILVTASNVLVKIDNILSKIDGKDISQILVDLKRAPIADAIIELKQTTKNLSNITNRIDKGPGTLHALIYDDTIHSDLESLLGGAKRNKVLNYFIRESIRKSEEKN